MNRSDIIYCSEKPASGNEERFELFSKVFVADAVSGAGRIFVREEFPMIGTADIQCFQRHVGSRKKIVVSGCAARVHPYRLIYIDQEGFCANFVDVPQEIRGNRHCYPSVFEAVPALLYVPPEIDLREIDTVGDGIEIYEMPFEKLLDRTLQLEALMIKIQGTACVSQDSAADHSD